MRKLVEEVAGEGLDNLLGEQVTLFCLNYIYSGKLKGVNQTCVLLGDAILVYDTGKVSDKDFTDSVPFPGDWYVQTAAIESFGLLK